MIRHVFLVAVLLLAACGPSRRASPTAGRGGVSFVGSWTSTEQAEARAALRVHFTRFEARWGPLPPITAELHSGDRIASGATGEALPWAGLFRVAAGRDLALAGATHELHHLIHDPSVAHVDSRWPAWDAEDAAAVAEVRQSRGLSGP